MSFTDLCLDYRNSLLASPTFQKLAARFPLTRPIARSHTRELFDLCAGFVYSQVLQACVQTGLCRTLTKEPQTIDAIARQLGLPKPSAELLVRAATSLRLAERRSGGRIGAGPLGAVLAANRGIEAMVEHHALLYADLRDPVALLREQGGETELAKYWPYAKGDSRDALGNGDVSAYCDLMSASQSMIMSEVLDAYPFKNHRRVLDVGGGEGVFLCEAARRNPALQVVLFDLPPVADLARQRFAEHGFADRSQAVGGDFFVDALPGGADLVTLVRVLHDHDDDAALALLKSARTALDEDGTLLIAEPMAGTPGAEASGDAYFGFYLLAMGSGQPRTLTEIEGLLDEAGFADVTQIPTRIPLLTRLLTAKPRM